MPWTNAAQNCASFRYRCPGRSTTTAAPAGVVCELLHRPQDRSRTHVHDSNDRVALNILAKLFPDREVIGVHAVDLVLGLGTLHCMTMQEPL